MSLMRGIKGLVAGLFRGPPPPVKLPVVGGLDLRTCLKGLCETPWITVRTVEQDTASLYGRMDGLRYSVALAAGDGVIDIAVSSTFVFPAPEAPRKLLVEIMKSTPIPVGCEFKLKDSNRLTTFYLKGSVEISGLTPEKFQRAIRRLIPHVAEAEGRLAAEGFVKEKEGCHAASEGEK